MRLILRVPQFGEVLADRLVAWRRSREQKFVYDSSRPLPREEIARIDRETEDAQRRVIEDLREALKALQTAQASEKAAAQAAAKRLQAARLTLRQAEANAVAALGALPT